MGWSPAQSRTRHDDRDTYNLFTSRVTDGRDGIDLDKTAEGRLFTGDKALGLNMADEIGTLTDTIEDMAEELDLANATTCSTTPAR